MNRLLKFAPYIFASIFIVVLILSLYTMLKSPFFFRDNSTDLEEKTYHYAFFLPASDYTFFKQLKEGALNASLSMDCSISFHEIDTDPLSLKMVPFSGLDGIGVYAYKEDSNTLANLAAISDAGIPIIQIENEIVRDEKTIFIGTNNFDSGKAIGKLALKSRKEEINLAVVYSEKNPGLMTKANLLELGLRSTLGYRVANIQNEYTTLNPLDAEGLTYRLIRQEKPVDVIVLTDPNDTLVTVQAIVDMNLVGEIQVIGFGDDERIKEYINKGLVLGTIVRDPFLIGFSSVLSLLDISTNGYTSAYVDTGISIITGGDKEK
ncbi:sugar ABC transporter substrate-binding protein [Oceanispirochaeta crateris]|uniref:Sugar ABC transporter substrate-binding protein n=1 Tax=Oceanispirochaeta crateris TaxID=2518645 RepID=A0A5C1QEV2_9SPIO|nr:substrate-binding domain-containing protein [Oceanispirochaeta crateris]QEN06593.1 sugar ABC transporter substrate-binding protein [Oceanispirochaeta crateris]